ncbi:germinal-center associated nuclear protein-like isoform X2 [Clavelina lepadiformis]|uniref:germinal-center associated nuclear protein-like isoform X2 n=1 Tax=Clavelina lepadiformis TaxID=159417 RepID=UPI0040436AC5
MAIVGMCMSMCPEKEFIFRKKHHLLHLLESPEVLFGKTSEIDLNHCVKEFHRSAAGEVICDPQLVRPSHVLLKTIDYLYSNVLLAKEIPFAVTYNFIFDRLRSIRQDAVIQMLQENEPISAMKILAKCIRFYLLAMYKLNIDPKLQIDAHINLSHTQDCMRSFLKLCYYNLCELDDNDRNEFLHILAAYVILNADTTEAISNLLCLPKSTRNTEILQHAMDIYFAYQTGNFIRISLLFQKLVHAEAYAALYALIHNMKTIRTRTVKLLCYSHNSKLCSFPAADLKKWLLLSSEKESVKFCQQFNLKVVQTNCIKFCKADYIERSSFSTDDCCIVNALKDISGKFLSQFLLDGHLTVLK